ncbi:MAG: cytochrome-c oxidase, cbb3-type subunit III [Rhodanobacteraceae bacterium]|nr:cytochrome-c oxidase, cbb3-type subunit III [Rhodanobacteraceae bacterium]
MSLGWTLYISIITIVNILAFLWLLWWTAKNRSNKAENEDTGHVWDGDIRELNRPLPKWWLNLFYITIVFAFVYLVLYPGLGSFAGTKQWSSTGEHDADVKAAEDKIAPIFARFRQQSLAELVHDADAQRLGASVFANNCATCHGSDAKGAKGYPNLTDGDWLWGGDPDTVLTTILDGRQAAMPAMGAVLGDDGVAAAAVYVQSLSGRNVDDALAARGQAHFQTICAACHGADGKGNPILGAPNLTDNTWLYGSDFNTVATTIRSGRNGQMPAHRLTLGEDRVRLAAAWVLAQSATKPDVEAH